MKTCHLVIAGALALAGCTGPDQPPTGPGPVAIAPATGPDPARCAQLLTALRALRDGPQPCASSDDCTVFHGGTFWDGCPVEVNKTNCAVLDRMRAEIDGLGCPVEKDALCAAQEVMWCVAGGCGGKVPPR